MQEKRDLEAKIMKTQFKVNVRFDYWLGSFNGFRQILN